MFVKFQPNEKVKNGNDYVVRALCKALNLSWLDVYSELNEVAMKKQIMPSDNKCFKEVLTNYGFEYVGIRNVKDVKRDTVQTFAKKNNKGTYILSIANHLTTIVDGDWFDIWDCGHKCVSSYYVLKTIKEIHK